MAHSTSTVPGTTCPHESFVWDPTSFGVVSC